MAMPGNVARTVTKMMEPPPFGFPPGPSGDAAIELGADPLAFITKAQLEHGDVVGKGEGDGNSIFFPFLTIFIFASVGPPHHPFPRFPDFTLLRRSE